jgi:hypothetical protein
MESHWDFWAWLAYGCIWVSALILAADAGLRLSPDLRAKVGWVVHSPVWGFTPLVLILVSGVIFIWQAIGPGLLGKTAGFSRMQLLPLHVRENEDPVKFNLYYINSGNLPAVAMHHHESAALLDKEATNADLDSAFNLLKAALKEVDTKDIQSEVQPGDINWFTFLYSFTKDQYNEVRNGPKYLYLLIYVKFRDAGLPKDKWWINESCFYTFKGQGMHTCGRHNRIYVSD